MKKCPYCGHENDDKNEVCINCRAELPKVKKDKSTEEHETDAPKKRVRS